MPAQAVIGEYKGKPIVTFSNPEKSPFPFSFGPGKAKLLLDFISEKGTAEFLKMLDTVAGKKE